MKTEEFENMKACNELAAREKISEAILSSLEKILEKDEALSKVISDRQDFSEDILEELLKTDDNIKKVFDNVLKGSELSSAEIALICGRVNNLICPEMPEPSEPKVEELKGFEIDEEISKAYLSLYPDDPDFARGRLEDFKTEILEKAKQAENKGETPDFNVIAMKYFGKRADRTKDPKMKASFNLLRDHYEKPLKEEMNKVLEEIGSIESIAIDIKKIYEEDKELEKRGITLGQFNGIVANHLARRECPGKNGEESTFFEEIKAFRKGGNTNSLPEDLKKALRDQTEKAAKIRKKRLIEETPEMESPGPEPKPAAPDSPVAVSPETAPSKDPKQVEYEKKVDGAKSFGELLDAIKTRDFVSAGEKKPLEPEEIIKLIEDREKYGLSLLDKIPRELRGKVTELMIPEYQKKLDDARKEYVDKSIEKESALKRIRKYLTPGAIAREDAKKNMELTRGLYEKDGEVFDPDKFPIKEGDFSSLINVRKIEEKSKKEQEEYKKRFKNQENEKLRSYETDLEIAALKGYYDNAQLDLQKLLLDDAENRRLPAKDVAEIFTKFEREDEVKLIGEYDKAKYKQREGNTWGKIINKTANLEKTFEKLSPREQKLMWAACMLGGTAVSVATGGMLGGIAAGILAGVATKLRLDAKMEQKVLEGIEKNENGFTEMLENMSDTKKIVEYVKQRKELIAKVSADDYKINNIKDARIKNTLKGAAAGALVGIIGHYGDIFRSAAESLSGMGAAAKSSIAGVAKLAGASVAGGAAMGVGIGSAINRMDSKSRKEIVERQLKASASGSAYSNIRKEILERQVEENIKKSEKSKSGSKKTLSKKEIKEIEKRSARRIRRKGGLENILSGKEIEEDSNRREVLRYSLGKMTPEGPIRFKVKFWRELNRELFDVEKIATTPKMKKEINEVINEFRKILGDEALPKKNSRGQVTETVKQWLIRVAREVTQKTSRSIKEAAEKEAAEKETTKK